MIMAALVTGCASVESVPAEDRILADLVGQTMGGREKCWHFQSREQIKDMVVEGTVEDDVRMVYDVSLVLSDDRVGGTYAAEADIVYHKHEQQWKQDPTSLRRT